MDLLVCDTTNTQHEARGQVLCMRRITHLEDYDSYISRCHGPICNRSFWWEYGLLSTTLMK